MSWRERTFEVKKEWREKGRKLGVSENLGTRAMVMDDPKEEKLPDLSGYTCQTQSLSSKEVPPPHVWHKLWSLRTPGLPPQAVQQQPEWKKRTCPSAKTPGPLDSPEEWSHKPV